MTTQPSLSIPRLAVLAVFFSMGAIFANWVTRIPDFQDRFALSEGQLGIVLLGISVGVLTALAAASGLIARYSSRLMTVVGGVAMCLSLTALALMPHPVALFIGLAVLGATMSTTDVSMNAQGVEVERRWGRPIMSSFHGAFSLGGFAGAGMGAWMISLDMPPLTHFAISTAIFLPLILIAGRGLLAIEHETGRDDPVFQIPPRALWPIGLVALFCTLGEGTMADWGAVYLENTVRAPGEVAALGFAAFSVTMTIGRFAGDWLTARFRPATLARAGGVIAGLGLLAAVLVPQVPVVLAGFAAVGIGLANIVPLAFSAAGNVPGVSPSKGISGVATIGYAGFLAGPPVIGLLAEAISLQASLGLIALMTLAIVPFAGAMRGAQSAAQT